ncbi:MAG: hypothetical protein BAJALOKI2v1_580005 [Promethearchaeota archaeon]|nr:MAG: hypothetical protein BAJALOKI2v1_580005 [Candidatus Lokiarchaeota archaeon]
MKMIYYVLGSMFLINPTVPTINPVEAKTPMRINNFALLFCKDIII